ncbi:branched-chain amino acid ABC transporter substrate-binding protein [Pseudescherichia vulneris]|nr:branched-chain amino acid ABC transporter substrate-binding protein [Pseudescherichia vulneris]WAH53529.1 branched-chain amino acid ABC transporter substrate-binding protein [Pseudescherichia vulneris]
MKTKPRKSVQHKALSAMIALAALGGSAVNQAQADETVIIGLASPLTGPSARIGKDLENGAQLAIDDVNKTHPTIGGKAVTFKLQSEDDQSDPRTAVAVAQRLVDSEVAGVVGHWNTGTSIPAARIYHDAGIAQVAPVATGHAYTQQGFDTSFRVMGHDDDGGDYAAKYAVQTLKAKRIAVIDDRTAFGQGLADEFIKSLEVQGIKPVDRQYVDEKTVDFNAVLTAIRSKNADLVFFGGVDSQAAPLARRLKQLGMKATLMGAGGFVSQTFLSLAQKEGEGVVALEPGLPVEKMPGGKAFEQAYQSKYHTHIELHAPFAYDATRVLIAAMQKADSVEASDYLPALRAINYAGVTGNITFDAQGNLKNPSFTVYKVVNGKWEPQTVLGGSAK